MICIPFMFLPTFLFRLPSNCLFESEEEKKGPMGFKCLAYLSIPVKKTSIIVCFLCLFVLFVRFPYPISPSLYVGHINSPLPCMTHPASSPSSPPFPTSRYPSGAHPCLHPGCMFTRSRAACDNCDCAQGQGQIPWRLGASGRCRYR